MMSSFSKIRKNKGYKDTAQRIIIKTLAYRAGKKNYICPLKSSSEPE